MHPSIWSMGAAQKSPGNLPDPRRTEKFHRNVLQTQHVRAHTHAKSQHQTMCFWLEHLSMVSSLKINCGDGCHNQSACTLLLAFLLCQMTQDESPQQMWLFGPPPHLPGAEKPNANCHPRDQRMGEPAAGPQAQQGLLERSFQRSILKWRRIFCAQQAVGHQ